MEFYAKMLRIGFYRIHESLVQKPVSIEAFWRIDGNAETKETIAPLTKEEYEEIKKIHGLK